MNGKGVTIGIIDGGFNLNHDDLQGIQVSKSWPMDKELTDLRQTNESKDHGSKVLFIAHKIAHKATFNTYSTKDCSSGECYISNGLMMHVMNQAAEDGVDIISMVII